MAETDKPENKKRIWQSRKGFDERMNYRLTNELKDRITGELIQPETFIAPNSVGQYTIHAESPYYNKQVEFMLKIAKAEDMIELKKRDKDGGLVEEGTILAEVLPKNPKHEVEELKGVVSAKDEEIAELKALLKKVNDK